MMNEAYKFLQIFIVLIPLDFRILDTATKKKTPRDSLLLSFSNRLQRTFLKTLALSLPFPCWLKNWLQSLASANVPWSMHIKSKHDNITQKWNALIAAQN